MHFNGWGGSGGGVFCLKIIEEEEKEEHLGSY